MRQDLISVMLACNDHRNGALTGEIDGIEVSLPDGDILLGLDGHARYTEAAEWVRIGRCKYPYQRHREWSGNWCWNEIWVTPEIAAKLLNDLRRSGNWSVHEGLNIAWEHWSSGETFTADHFEPSNYDESGVV